MTSADASHELSEPDEGAVLAGAPGDVVLSEMLGLCDEFLRCHASPVVHAELRQFLTARGHHPITGIGAFLDSIGFAALSARRPSPL